MTTASWTFTFVFCLSLDHCPHFLFFVTSVNSVMTSVEAAETGSVQNLLAVAGCLWETL